MLARFFDSRGRGPVLRACVALLVSLAIGWAGILLMRDGSIATVTLAGGLLGATVAKLGAELARRCHDRGARGWPILVALVVVALALVGYSTFVLPAPLFYIIAAVATIGLGWILIAPGDRGDNRYGPPPHDGWTATGASTGGTTGRTTGRAALIVGLMVTFGGALAGFGGGTWSDAVARRHAENERWSQEHDVADPSPAAASPAAAPAGEAARPNQPENAR